MTATVTATGWPGPQPLGATLGATGANDLLGFRTAMNNGQGRGRGHGLIRTGPDARTWNYGSEGWGNSPRLASWYPLDLLRPSARAAVLTSTVRGSASSSARVIPLLICLFGCTPWSSGTASALEVSAAFGFPVTLPSRLPKDGRRCLGLVVWPRRARLAIGRGRRQHAAAAARAPYGPGPVGATGSQAYRAGSVAGTPSVLKSQSLRSAR